MSASPFYSDVELRWLRVRAKISPTLAMALWNVALGASEQYDEMLAGLTGRVAQGDRAVSEFRLIAAPGRPVGGKW